MTAELSDESIEAIVSLVEAAEANCRHLGMSVADAVRMHLKMLQRWQRHYEDLKLLDLTQLH
jgi:diphthamide synthase (EF-2-diphthine--ammonia ligase)